MTQRPAYVKSRQPYRRDLAQPERATASEACTLLSEVAPPWHDDFAGAMGGEGTL